MTSETEPSLSDFSIGNMSFQAVLASSSSSSSSNNKKKRHRDNNEVEEDTTGESTAKRQKIETKEEHKQNPIALLSMTPISQKQQRRNSAAATTTTSGDKGGEEEEEELEERWGLVRIPEDVRKKFIAAFVPFMDQNPQQCDVKATPSFGFAILTVTGIVKSMNIDLLAAIANSCGYMLRDDTTVDFSVSPVTTLRLHPLSVPEHKMAPSTSQTVIAFTDTTVMPKARRESGFVLENWKKVASTPFQAYLLALTSYAENYLGKETPLTVTTYHDSSNLVALSSETLEESKIPISDTEKINNCSSVTMAIRGWRTATIPQLQTFKNIFCALVEHVYWKADIVFCKVRHPDNPLTCMFIPRVPSIV